MNILTTMFFSFEIFHILGHLAVLLRIRLLPRKDLVRIRWYFLSDAFSVFVSSFLLTRKLQWLGALQNIQHLYYFIFWDKTLPAKKIINWSSLDWISSPKNKYWEWNNIIGTTFDVLVHTAMVYLLGQMITTIQMVVGLGISLCCAFLVFYNPHYAWSSPWSIPKWVQKRIHPLVNS